MAINTNIIIRSYNVNMHDFKNTFKFYDNTLYDIEKTACARMLLHKHNMLGRLYWQLKSKKFIF